MRSLSQAKSLAGAVSVDVTGYSVSFNEYLKLISIKRRAEPDQDSLTEVQCSTLIGPDLSRYFALIGGTIIYLNGFGFGDFNQFFYFY